MYPIRSFPQILGCEASGEVVALPTDEKVLKDDWYKKRGLEVGSRVAVVRILRLYRGYLRAQLSLCDAVRVGRARRIRFVALE